jgi:hypothetical protein
MGRIRVLCILLFGVSPVWAGQVCDTRAYPLSAPTTRFEDNGDGTVTDRATKLMWMRCSGGQQWAGGSCSGQASAYDWRAAQNLAGDVNVNGSLFFNDWRVPSLRELASIVERECTDPRVNLTVFPNTPAGLYWTASARPGVDAPTLAYALSFGNDGVVPLPKDKQHHVRLVRDAR